MSSSLLLQQCPTCLVRLILIDFVMGGRWPYSCCFVGCCLHCSQLIGQVGRVFANGPRDLGSIQGRVISKTLKMVLDTALLNTQRYKVRIECKVKQSRERSSALPYTLV